MFWNRHLCTGAPLLTLLLFFLVTPYILSAQPSNDSCAVARRINLPLNFGEPLQISGHNIGATPEIPATTTANCSPGGVFSGLGADVWYNFTAPSDMCVRIELTGLEQPEFSLRKGFSCFLNEDIACVYSEEGNATEVVELEAGEEYWLRVSGMWYLDQGYFDLTITRTGCGFDDPCMISDSYSISPEPSIALINGEFVDYYLPETTVNFCYTVDEWVTLGNNWLHSIEIDLGSGWDVNSVVPQPPPPFNCNSGEWGWYDLWFSCNTGEVYGPGFAYDSDNGLSCGGFPFDGEPGNNFGDGPGQCFPIEFCWSITVKSCEQLEEEPGTDLSINITALADSESGSYNVLACDNQVDEIIELRTFACGDLPPSDPCFPQEPFIEVFPVSCQGEMDGSFTLDNVDTDSLSNIYIYRLDDLLIEAFFDVELPFTIPSILDTGFYGVVLETPGIGDEGFCEGTLYTIIKVAPPFETFARIVAEQDCAVDSVQLVARIWPDTLDPEEFTFNWSGPNDFFSTETSPTVTESGEYLLTTIRGDCRVTDAIIVTFRDALALEVDYAPTPPCPGDLLQLTASGASSAADYEWLIPPEAGLGTPIYDTENDSWTLGTLDGTVTLQLVGFSSTGCSDTISFTAVPAAFPSFDYSAALEDCEDPSVTVSIAEDEDLASIIWQDDGSSANPRLFSDIPAGTSIEVSVLITNNAGCELTETVQILGPGVDINASDTLICPGDAVVLTASSATAYTWSTGETTQDIIVYPEAPETTYSVSITNGYACEQQDQVTIAVLPAPEAAFIYTNNALVYQFQPNAPDDPDLSYWWDFGDGTLSVNYTPQHTFLGPGMYTVSLATTGTCGTDTTVQIIDIPFAPTVGFSSDINSGCAPLTIAFSNESTGADTYQWSFPGGTPSSSDLEDPIIVYNEPGVYPVSLSATGSGGSATSTIEGYVEVLSGPEGTLEVSSIDLLNVQFTTTSNNVDEIIWNFGDGTSANNITDPLHSYPAPGTYTVNLFLINTCDTLMLEEEVTLSLATPIADFSTETDRIGCAPLSVTFSNTSINADTYQWTFPGGVPESSTEESPVVVYLEEGVYPVQLIAGNLSGSDTASIVDYVSVFPQPSASFTFTDDLLEVTFSSEMSNTDSFSWDFGDGNSSTEANPTHTYEIGGSYEVSLTVTNDCGSTIITETIVVSRPIPNVAFTTVEERRGCAPLSLTFINQSENALTYQWTFPGGNPASSNEVNPSVVYETPGIYLVQLNAVNETGGNALVAESYVEVIGLPSGSFSFSAEELDVDFTATAANTNSYEWDFGDGNLGMGQQVSHQYASNGTYQVTLRLSNECDTLLLTQEVTVMRALPIAEFITASDTSGCAPLTVSFINQSSGADGYQWTFEGGTPAMSTLENPTVTYSTAGIYPVELLAFNESGTDQLVVNDMVEVLGLPFAEISLTSEGLTVDFTAMGTAVDSYFWQFGDGSVSMEQNPSHTYSDEGMYTVQLSVSNECGSVTTSVDIELMITSSNDQMASQANWKIYPNPNAGQMTVALENWQNFGPHHLLVYNSAGELIMSKPMAIAQAAEQFPVWLELPAGMYWFEIKDQNMFRQGIEKVIIQR
ncbi:MAG: PKD domain-containing protein [Bacteroidota bacterium]